MIYTPYFLQSVTVDSSRIIGAQSVSASKNYDSTTILPKGFIGSTNFYKRPSYTVSITRFLDSDSPSIAFNLLDYIENNSVGSYPVHSVAIDLIDDQGTSKGIQFSYMLLSSIAYSYSVQGFFTEQISYIGSASSEGGLTSITAGDSGLVKRRKDFLGVTFPDQPPEFALQSVDFSMNINYGDVPSFGAFKTFDTKYITVPVDISVSIETINRGYGQDLPDNDTAEFIDSISESAISISGPPSIAINDCFLVGFEQNGGDAGNSDYSRLRYTYKSTSNSLVIQ
jgi:hypothetical protein